jgi:7-cyano-7-deazaguanine synthase
MKTLAILSLSGGMDSTSLLLNLIKQGYEVHTLSFNYGQKHKIELERAKANIEYLATKGIIIPHTVIDLSILGKLYNSALTSDHIAMPEGHYADENMKATVVPNRNAIFSSIVYGYALSLSEQHNIDAVISLGIHAGDHAIYPDCRQDFRDALEHAFKIGNWGSERIQYIAPYLTENKFSILKDALDSCEKLGLDFDTVMANTNTSYNPTPDGKASGKSGADVERILAFHELGRKDPIEYVDGWDIALENALQAEGEYKLGLNEVK